MGGLASRQGIEKQPRHFNAGSELRAALSGQNAVRRCRLKPFLLSRAH